MTVLSSGHPASLCLLLPSHRHMDPVPTGENPGSVQCHLQLTAEGPRRVPCGLAVWAVQGALVCCQVPQLWEASHQPHGQSAVTCVFPRSQSLRFYLSHFCCEHLTGAGRPRRVVEAAPTVLSSVSQGPSAGWLASWRACIWQATSLSCGSLCPQAHTS